MDYHVEFGRSLSRVQEGIPRTLELEVGGRGSCKKVFPLLLSSSYEFWSLRVKIYDRIRTGSKNLGSRNCSRSVDRGLLNMSNLIAVAMVRRYEHTHTVRTSITEKNWVLGVFQGHSRSSEKMTQFNWQMTSI